MTRIHLFSFLRKTFLQTPLYGRTIAILGFLFLLIKQITLIITSHILFQEATRRATAGHYLAYLISDFLVFFVLVFFVVINRFLKKKIWRIIINLLSLTLLIFFIIDIISLYVFQSSISIFDISSGMLNPSVVKVTWSIIGMIVLFGIIGISVFLFAQTKVFRKYQKICFAGSIFIFAVICVFTSITSQPGFRFPDNIFSNNRDAIKGFVHDQVNPATGNNQEYLSYFTSLEGDKKKPNIIVIFAESLSAIDSQKVGGVYNNLPYFDKIQADGMTFTNFLANGCTSDTAHIALLQGVEPWKFARQEDNAYTGYRSSTPSLAVFFAKQGYNPLFLSTASLAFLDQRDFISRVGFTTIEGEELFSNQKKYVFDAAPDQALYKQALQTIQQQKKPYLLTLQTISFHKPYDTPYGDNEANALRYADKSLYYFYQELKKNGFFDNGLLVIVGDHRKMEPLSEKEKEALGPLRYARSLATVIGTGIIPGSINDKIIQHTDFFYSLKKLVGQTNVTVSKFFNDVFSPRKGRDRGVVFCRYFTNRYGIVTTNNSGAGFEYISSVKNIYPNIYSYIQAYSNYQSFVSTGTKKNLAGTGNMIIIAHQGSPKQEPGNSLAGFLLAKKDGANGIEFDVSQTSDKKNVVVHGEMLRETVCGGKTKVTTHTLDRIQKNCPLKNGEKIITLEEMLNKVKGLFDYYFIEIKAYTPNIQQETLDAIETVKKLGMENKVIFTSYDKTATYIFGSSKNIHAGRDTYDANDIKTIPYFTHEYYLLNKDIVGPDIPQQIADMGKKLVVYVVNTRDDLEKLYHKGVHIIMTDDVIAMKEDLDKMVLDQ